MVGNHLCYIRAVETKEIEPGYVFYDFEKTQETLIQCINGYISTSPQGCQTCSETDLCNTCRQCINVRNPCVVINLVVARRVCSTCIESYDSTCVDSGLRCLTCKKRHLW